MLRAKGHRPTPRISPFWVSLRLKWVPSSPMICALMMNPKDVATRAKKQVQNSHLGSIPVESSSWELLACPTITLLLC